MKIGIVTLPLHVNYGGILQAYALSRVLKDMGHDVIVINKLQYRYLSLFQKIYLYSWRIFQKVFLLRKNVYVFPERDFNRYQDYRKQFMVNTAAFIDEYITKIDILHYGSLKRKSFDAIVVGSDQIWRPRYIENTLCTSIDNAFLSFTKGWDVKSIAYAASFGTNEWEYTEKQTQVISRLAKKMDAISVREFSGVEMCEKYLGVNSMHVLDPTLLLDVEEYRELYGSVIRERKQYIMSYVLDNSAKVNDVIKIIEEKTGLKHFSAKAASDEDVQPPVEEWLYGFDSSDLIVTDSFHACVFSLIFHKHFIVFTNAKRGNERIDSLLSMFGLQDRKVDANTVTDVDIQALLDKKIDFEQVDKILDCKKTESVNFLKNNLR